MGMFQNFMLRAMLKSKMKGVPEAEQEKIFSMLEKNPDFFQKIAEEVEKRKKAGQGEMEAVMQVMRENQSELQSLMQK